MVLLGVGRATGARSSSTCMIRTFFEERPIQFIVRIPGKRHATNTASLRGLSFEGLVHWRSANCRCMGLRPVLRKDRGFGKISASWHRVQNFVRNGPRLLVLPGFPMRGAGDFRPTNWPNKHTHSSDCRVCPEGASTAPPCSAEFQTSFFEMSSYTFHG